MKFSKKDISFVLIVLLLIGTLSYLIKRHIYQSGSGSGAYMVAGIIQFKTFRVFRKYPDRVVWNSIESGSDVFLYDTIMTQESSDAKIILKDNAKIYLEANSMVEIDELDEAGILGLKLKKGTLSVKGNEDHDTFLLTVNGEKVIIGNSEAKFYKNKNGLKIEVKNGEIEIRDKNNKSVKLDKSTILSISADGKWTKQKVNIDLLKPNDNAIFWTKTGQSEITFHWKNRSASSNLILEYTKDPFFSQSNKVRVSRLSSYTTKLRIGYWYFRLKSNDTNKAISRISFFQISKNENLGVYEPENNRKIPFEGKTKLVTFRWKSPDDGSSVRFILGHDKKLHDKIKDITTNQNQVSVELNKEGSYYYKVLKRSRNGDQSESGKVLLKETQERKLDLYLDENNDRKTTNNKKSSAPNNKKESVDANNSIEKDKLNIKVDFSKHLLKCSSKYYFYSIEELLLGKAIVNWSLNLPYSKNLTYKALLTNRRGVLIQKANLPIRKMKLPSNLSMGRHGLTVVTTLVNGEQSKVVQARCFVTVTKSKSFSYISPLNNSTHKIKPNQKNKSILVQWGVSQSLKNAKVKISVVNIKTLKKKILVVNLVNGNSRLNLPPGKFKISMVASYRNKVISKTFSRTIRIIASLSPPILKEPMNDKKLSLSQLRNLTFLWSKVYGANLYQLSIYRFHNGKYRRIFKKKLSSLSYRYNDYQNLRSSKIKWRVIAIEKLNGKIVRYSKPSTNTFFIKKPSPPQIKAGKIK